MNVIALLVLVVLVVGGLIYYAIRKGRQVDALISLGRTVFKFKVK